VGSIPIARSINLVDLVALPLLRPENGANWPEFWTQLGPNSILPGRHFSVLRLSGITDSRLWSNAVLSMDCGHSTVLTDSLSLLPSLCT